MRSAGPPNNLLPAGIRAQSVCDFWTGDLLAAPCAKTFQRTRPSLTRNTKEYKGRNGALGSVSKQMVFDLRAKAW
jgi:hypothetical protein